MHRPRLVAPRHPSGRRLNSEYKCHSALLLLLCRDWVHGRWLRWSGCNTKRNNCPVGDSAADCSFLPSPALRPVRIRVSITGAESTTPRNSCPGKLVLSLQSTAPFSGATGGDNHRCPSIGSDATLQFLRCNGWFTSIGKRQHDHS